MRPRQKYVERTDGNSWDRFRECAAQIVAAPKSEVDKLMRKEKQAKQRKRARMNKQT